MSHVSYLLRDTVDHEMAREAAALRDNDARPSSNGWKCPTPTQDAIEAVKEAMTQHGCLRNKVLWKFETVSKEKYGSIKICGWQCGLPFTSEATASTASKARFRKADHEGAGDDRELSAEIK